jgi:hypothetical protein
MIANISRNARTFSHLCKGAYSHDSFTRMLYKPIDYLIYLVSLTQAKNIKGGYFILDDTVIEKPYSSKLEGAIWAYSSSHKKCIYGYHLVLLIWTDGTRKIVIDYRLHSKNSKNKINLALELLSYARNQVRMKPEFVLFDSWYSSKKILKRIKDYGWYFVTRLKKNRKFGNTSLIKYKTNPYWMAKDRLSCGLKVQIVRNGKQYFATNLMRLSKTEILNLYRIRQTIEEMNKLLKFCGLNDCQARKIKALNKHVQCTILALTLLEQESRRQGHSIYSLKKDNRLKEAYVQKLCETKLSLAA